MAFFNNNNGGSSEKFTYVVNGKADRNDQFKEIITAIVGGFGRIFETKELYSMRVEITFNKNREKMTKEEKEMAVAEALDVVDSKD